MSYPQPNSDQYAVNGYSYFRLNTLLASPGDIYESTQGAHAFAIGPDSDIASVTIKYFDDQVPTFVNEVSISPERSFVGLVGARNEVQYAPSGRPGRILIYPSDLYDSTFLPSGFQEEDAFRVVPRLDVIQYFTPENPVPRRNDRRWFFQDLPISRRGAIFDSLFIFPLYGRKYTCIRFTNDTGFPVTISITAFNYSITPAGIVTQDKVIFAAAVIPGGNTVYSGIFANRDGVFDAMVFTYLTTGGVTAGSKLSVTSTDFVVDAQ